MDNVQLCESLMKWLQTFEVEAPHQTVEEVSDGVAIAQVLAQIAPEWFGISWISKIKTDAGNNWRLKVSNLKKIVEGIVDYYHEILNQQLTDFNKPDVIQIGEKCDPAELGRLLQLILGCAINCNEKQRYITQIMSLEESVQQVIMQSIQELESSSHGPGLSLGLDMDSDLQTQKLVMELELATEARDQMSQRCHELDMQVAILQEEKASVLHENRTLQERLREFETLEEPAGHRFKELRKQVDILKEDLFKMETSRDDYKMKVDMQEKELLELQMKVDELQKVADEARLLKDEVDILRETADMARKYEGTIESYKKRLEEVGDLRRQVKILEDKNTDYMQQNMELEEELKKNSTLKPQLELYKKQIAELDHRLTEETKRADKVEFESKKLQEKVNALQREKERLIVERDSLKETNEELKCSQLQETGSRPNSSPDTLLTETLSEKMIPPEIKEKLLRLQHENKMLKLNQRSEEEEEKLSNLQTLLEDEKRRVTQLTKDNRVANKRIMELESQVEEMQGGGDVAMRHKHRVVELQEQLRNVQGDKEKVESQIEDMESSLTDHKDKLAALQENVRRKDSEIMVLQETIRRKEGEIATLNERHSKYIEKAKSAIRSMDKPNVESGADVLRSQIQAKNKIIEDLEVQSEQNKQSRDMEEKLMTTAFYNLGYLQQRASVDLRLATLNPGPSFLTRQRQPTGRRIPHSLEAR